VSATLEKLHELGFRVAVTVRPFVSTFSETYRAGLELDGGAWIGQGAAGRSPALTTFDGDASVAVADVTSASVSQWLADRLRSLVVDNGLDGIVVESSCVDRLPPRYATRRSVADPSALDAAFLDAAKTLADVSVIAVTSATKMPRLPTFIALPSVPCRISRCRSFFDSIVLKKVFHSVPKNVQKSLVRCLLLPFMS